MVSTLSSGSTFDPQTTGEATFPGDTSLDNFTFLDFLPECTGEDGVGLSTRPVYESFRTLVDRANNWLRSNPKSKLKTCESVQLLAKKTPVKTKDSAEKMFYMDGITFTRYIIGLRIWISETEEEGKGQQIGYLNVIPQQLGGGGLLSSPTFETLDDVLIRFNNMIEKNPIPGRIMNVGSHSVKVSQSQNVDLDRTTFRIYNSHYHRFMFILRVFFEIADGIPKEIGIVGMMDFKPDQIKKTMMIVNSKYEPFSNVVDKASNWCKEQQGKRICNFQTLEFKIKGEVNTQKMSYQECSRDSTYYVRILRVVYWQSWTGLQEATTMQEITCKTIVPIQISRDFPNFEDLQVTKERLQAWVKVTGVQVINAETTVIRMYSYEDAKIQAEKSFAFNIEEHRNDYFMFIIRLYINGGYLEPPPELLPPLPDIEEPTKCCILS